MRKSGSTATILYVTDVHDLFIIAHVGDSRAVLSKGASYAARKTKVSAIQLTLDHTPADDSERKRVEDSGGKIKSGGGIDRVEGILAISRSIGDAHLQHFLSHTPDIFVKQKKEIREMCRDETADSHNES